jgi:hypothetical protein
LFFRGKKFGDGMVYFRKQNGRNGYNLESVYISCYLGYGDYNEEIAYINLGEDEEDYLSHYDPSKPTHWQLTEFYSVFNIHDQMLLLKMISSVWVIQENIEGVVQLLKPKYKGNK